MKRTSKKRAGRKPLAGGRKTFGTTLPQYVIDHLRRDGNASAKIIELVDADIAREEQQANNYDVAQAERH